MWWGIFTLLTVFCTCSLACSPLDKNAPLFRLVEQSACLEISVFQTSALYMWKYMKVEVSWCHVPCLMLCPDGALRARGVMHGLPGPPEGLLRPSGGQKYSLLGFGWKPEVMEFGLQKASEDILSVRRATCDSPSSQKTCWGPQSSSSTFISVTIPNNCSRSWLTP